MPLKSFSYHTQKGIATYVASDLNYCADTSSFVADTFVEFRRPGIGWPSSTSSNKCRIQTSLILPFVVLTLITTKTFELVSPIVKAPRPASGSETMSYSS